MTSFKNGELIFNNLPFYIGVQDAPTVMDFPGSLPFKLAFNEDLGLIVQEYDDQVAKWLDGAYQFGSSLSTPLGESELSKQIAEDVINAIQQSLSLNGKKIEECSFLEVGCGKGYLLHLLKRLGAKRCLGIEPDPHSKEGSNKYDVEIINAFFNPEIINEKFDVVFTYGVLEHIYNPLEFLIGLKACTKKDGLLFNAVPNCEEHLRIGDFSLLVHEHFNYFTAQSLDNIYTMLGLQHVQYCNAKFGWALYMWGKNNTDGELFTNDNNYRERERERYDKYVNLCWRFTCEIQRMINSFEDKTIGIYGAYFNYLIFNWNKAPRFFDSDTFKHGKYLPKSVYPIESPQALLDNPVDYIIIAPIHHDLAIRNFLENKLEIPSSKIISMKEVYNNLNSETQL